MNPRILGRSRLTDRLAEAASHRVTLIIAPAGYGKSVALDHYLARSDRRYVRLDVASARQTAAEFVRDLKGTLGDADYGTVVVDGLQAIQNDPAAIEYLVGSVERTKGRVAWILASRSTIGLPVGTWIAYDDCELIVGADDLRFTTQELAEAALQLGRSAEADELDDVLRFTEGWPAAVSVALRAGLRSQDRPKRCGLIRETSQRLWAEQVYPEFSDDDRALLAVAGVLPEIDVRLLGLAGFANALEIVESVRERTAVLEAVTDGVYRCSSLFREFLLRQTELLGKDAQQAAYIRAARALETDGDIESALDAYVTACSTSDVARLLESHGFDLLERGRGDAAGRAIESLSDTTKRSSPRILALRGVLQSLMGNPVRAEALLRRSLARAKGDRDLVADASVRLALLLTNQGANIANLLVPIAEDPEQSAPNRAEAWSLLAAQLALSGDAGAARSAMGHVDELLIDIEVEPIRAKVLQRIGVAAMYVGEAERARKALSHAAGLAMELELFSLASRAYANLSNLMLHHFDDVGWQLWYAEQASAAAVKACDTFDVETAALQLLDAELRLGRTDRSSVLEIQLAAARSGDQSRAHYLAPSRALRLAWEGRFSDAHCLLAPSWSRLHHDFDQVVSGAQCALYLALDGKRDASIGALTRVLTLVGSIKTEGLFSARSIAMAHMCCGIAEAVNGRLAHADRIIHYLSKGADDLVIGLMLLIAEELIAIARRSRRRGSATLSEALERLAPLGYAHVSLLFRSVSRVLEEQKSATRMERLTPTEGAVLKLLAEGLSPKEIAVRRGCSINTVRAHTARSFAKLRCNGRAEAIALGRRMGILD